MSATRLETRTRNRLAGDDLVLTSSSLGNPDFPVLLEAAMAAGFQGLSLWPRNDYQRARDAGRSAAEMRTIISDHGLAAHDVDALVRWVGADDPGWPYLQEAPEALVWEAAVELEVEFVNCILVGQPAPQPEALASCFHSVCERANELGLRATLEFATISRVPDLATARRVVELADCPNGSLMLDTWHLSNCDWPLAEVADLPTHYVGGIQLSDRSGDPNRQHSMRDRLPPGEGVLGLADLYRLLEARKIAVPLTLEVFNPGLLEALGPRGAAECYAKAAREQRAASLRTRKDAALE